MPGLDHLIISLFDHFSGQVGLTRLHPSQAAFDGLGPGPYVPRQGRRLRQAGADSEEMIIVSQGDWQNLKLQP